MNRRKARRHIRTVAGVLIVFVAMSLSSFANQDFEIPITAPGSSGSFDFKVKNSAFKECEYLFSFENEISCPNLYIPIKVKVIDDQGGFLLGDKGTWEPVKRMDSLKWKETFKAGESKTYKVLWQWPFERGKDKCDTSLGNAATKEDIVLTIKCCYTAREIAGTKKQSFTGDNNSIVMWAQVFILCLSLICIGLKFQRSDRNEEDN